MIIRAAFVSVFFHLLILLVQNPRDHGLGLPGKGRAVRPLTLALTPVSESGLAVDADPALPLAPAPKAATRQAPATIAVKRTPSRPGATLPSAQDASRAAATQPPSSGDLPPSRAPPSAELLSQYRLSLARSARPLKVYPSLARLNGWEGTVVVRVMPTARPGSPRVALENSSGHAVLDSQALDMVEQAVSQAVLPEGLRGYATSLSLAVVYSAND